MIKSMVMVCSHHHGNTEKVAGRIAEILGARTASPQKVDPKELEEYDLVGFGSGIYDGRHHRKLLDLADSLPPAKGKKVFLFSTDGMPRFLMKSSAALQSKMLQDHAPLREKLQAKGYTVVGEFDCAGENTNSFLKYFGGFNQGRPDAQDLERAAGFAHSLKGES